MNRRQLLKRSALVAAAVLLPRSLFAKDRTKDGLALSTWQSKMLTLGAKWAAWIDQQAAAVGAGKQSAMLAWGVESQIWYYDGGRVLLQVADYLHDSWQGLPAKQAVPKHNPSYYAYLVLDQYENYVLSQPVPPGFGPGYRVFPYGITMAAWRNPGNPKHKQALDFLIKNAAFIASGLRYIRQHDEPKGFNWSPWAIRESAYAADVLICQWMLEGTVHPLLNPAIYDCVVADLQAFMTPGSQSYLGTVSPTNADKSVNNFMIGLALATLIHYYDQTVLAGRPDTKIPPIVKQTLDFMWANCVEPSSSAMYYNNLCQGQWCKLPDGTKQIYTASSLNNLSSPAWAWYATHFDPSYQTQFDALFSAGIMGAGKSNKCSVNSQDYSFTGKQYSQNFKWSFDAIRYSQGNSVSTVAQAANPVLTTEPAYPIPSGGKAQ
jgi:hypothetical protein